MKLFASEKSSPGSNASAPSPPSYDRAMDEKHWETEVTSLEGEKITSIPRIKQYASQLDSIVRHSTMPQTRERAAACRQNAATAWRFEESNLKQLFGRLEAEFKEKGHNVVKYHVTPSDEDARSKIAAWKDAGFEIEHVQEPEFNNIHWIAAMPREEKSDPEASFTARYGSLALKQWDTMRSLQAKYKGVDRDASQLSSFVPESDISTKDVRSISTQSAQRQKMCQTLMDNAMAALGRETNLAPYEGPESIN